VVDFARVIPVFALIIQHSGRLDPFFIELDRDSVKPNAGCAHSEDTAHGRRGFFVDHKMVLILRIAPVTVSGVSTHELSVFRTCLFDGFDLFAGVTAVKFIK